VQEEAKFLKENNTLRAELRQTQNAFTNYVNQHEGQPPQSSNASLTPGTLVMIGMSGELMPIPGLSPALGVDYPPLAFPSPSGAADFPLTLSGLSDDTLIETFSISTEGESLLSLKKEKPSPVVPELEDRWKRIVQEE
jgi:hypothetical protein